MANRVVFFLIVHLICSRKLKVDTSKLGRIVTNYRFLVDQENNDVWVSQILSSEMN